MTLSYSTNRYKTKSGKKYYLGLDSESYSVYSFTKNSDFDNKTGTLMYTEPILSLIHISEPTRRS